MKLDTLKICKKERENALFWNRHLGMEKIALKVIPPSDPSQVGLQFAGKKTLNAAEKFRDEIMEKLKEKEKKDGGKEKRKEEKKEIKAEPPQDKSAGKK